MSERPARRSSAAELQRRNRELSILNAIASALNSTVDLNEALHAALAQVAALLDLHAGWVWLLDEETCLPYLAASQDLPPGLANYPRRMEGTCYCLDTYTAGDLSGAANVNVVTCTRLKGLVDGANGLRYHASIPLYAQEKKLGVLNVASSDWRELAPDDLRLLHTIGDLLSIAVERARLFARSTQMGAVEERNRLAREIHDTLAQGIAGIALRLESADALAEANADPEQVRQSIQSALKQARQTLEEARRSVLDLRAAPLEGRTLAQAVAALAAASEPDDPHITTNITGAAQPLPVRIEVGIYRIIQEALANIRRHAHARNATIQLEITPDALTAIVSDDGRGFNPERGLHGHYGLLGIRERARLLGGEAQVRSMRGRGTRMEVRIPLIPLEKDE
ncbi:MAG TPA: GAF domain-containing sensor histidine kinase [Ktedonobacterales bacterium]|nr:GAF domain-containing sensor histidine kinase [Ktedonobacterales bacterium]